ncbi:MAG: hypothetical protein DYG89_52415 [Caldilinea sp. CFX5]|nr:hypothetical protein [Caldilinea sp. CFX5]
MDAKLEMNPKALPTPSWMFWTGITVSMLAILFLIFDSVIKVLTLAPAVEATTQLGYHTDLVMGIGTKVYVYPCLIFDSFFYISDNIQNLYIIRYVK